MTQPPSSTNADVLIVGAGPVGLTLACELQRAGVSFRIINKALAPTNYSQASVVHARVQELFALNGALERIHERGHWMRPQKTRAFGRLLGFMRVTGVDSPYPGPWIVSQSWVEKALRAHLASRQVVVEDNKALNSLSHDEQGVTAEIVDAQGRVEVVRSRWLVGADGSNSKVRQLLDVPFEGKKYGDEFEFFLGDVMMPPDFPTEHGYTFLHDDGAVLLIIPQEGTHRIIISRPTRTPGNKSPLPLDELQGLVHQYGPREAVMSDPIWLSRFGTQRRIAKQLRVGRVLLAGDSAHQHIPLGGQGMNTGVQDAFNLGWKLALVHRGLAPDSLLDSYHEERHAIAQVLVDTTDKFFGAASRPTPFFKWRARLLGPLVFRSPPIQKRIRYAMSQLKVHYRFSKAVLDLLPVQHRGPKAGERAMDVVLRDNGHGRALQLFSLFRDPRHTLLLFTGERAGPAERTRLLEAGRRVAGAYGRVIQVVLIAVDRAFPGRVEWPLPAYRDNDAVAQKRYGAEGPTLYLVRPDSYLGACADLESLPAFEAHLAALFPTCAAPVQAQREAVPA